MSVRPIVVKPCSPLSQRLADEARAEHAAQLARMDRDGRIVLIAAVSTCIVFAIAIVLLIATGGCA